MLTASRYPITVVDVGARYGIHPSFSGINTQLNYFAFEPDPEEASRLAGKYQNAPWYKVFPLAVGESDGEVTLRILKHHGQSTILTPNQDSAWFGSTRRGDGDIEREERVRMTTLDRWCAENEVTPDFLKIDTEGFDFFVLRGAAAALSSSVLAVRCEVLFHDVFHGARLFDDIFRLMREHGFCMANLAYDGKGAHQSFFCPGDRWGLLTGCEAVFIKNPASLSSMEAVALAKYCIFCLRNDLPDLAFKVISDNQSLWANVRSTLEDDSLFRYLDFLYQHAINKLKYIPGTGFQQAVESYTRFFGKEYSDLHRFYESSHLNP